MIDSCERPALFDDGQQAGMFDWLLGSKKPRPVPGPDEISLPGLSVGDGADEDDRVIVKKNGPVHIAYYKAQESSVRLDTGGSGFFISSDGLVATASHAVPIGSTKLMANTVDGTSYLAELISRDVDNDLALLKVVAEDRLKQFPFLKLNTKDAYSEELAVTGHPKVWPSVYISMGKALDKPYKTNYPAWNKANDLLRMNAHVEGGNSGGAVVDYKGDVRGVLVGSQGRAIAVVVPSKNVDHLLKWTERAATEKITKEGGYNLEKTPEAVARLLPKPEGKASAQDSVAKQGISELKQPPKEQPTKELPQQSKEQQLPSSWIKNPGAGSFVSPYGKIYQNKMNYYEQKKIQERPLPGGHDE